MRQRHAAMLAWRALPVLGLGLLLGIAAPFSSNPPLSTTVRLVFWVGMVIVGYGAALAAARILPAMPGQRANLRLLLIALASALPLTFVAAWIVQLLRPGHVYQPLQLPGLFGVVAAVQLVIVFLLLRTTDSTARHPAANDPVVSDAPHAFPQTLLSRLPSRLGDDIVALEAEDHYLRVHTALGSDLILMRLSDAIAAMDASLGRQVHRSWWVAHDAIADVVRSDQRLQLVLSNGLTVPVGRTYAAAVRSLPAFSRR